MPLFYVTFGADQKHLKDNKFFDCKCVAQVDADTYIEARRKVMAEFGDDWDALDKEAPNLRYFPRGLIEVS